jgi:alanyl-tRNA synthetase
MTVDIEELTLKCKNKKNVRVMLPLPKPATGLLFAKATAYLWVTILPKQTPKFCANRKVKQKNQEYYQLVLSKPPFYAEMGGQVGDSGSLSLNPTPTERDFEEGRAIRILDTKKENNLAVHIVNKLPEDVTETFTATIDIEKRKATECNHSATHLLHEALREVLGTHVEQKGSFVSPEALRFDFRISKN